MSWKWCFSVFHLISDYKLYIIWFMTSRDKCNNYVGRIQIFRSMQSTPFREGTLMCTVQSKLMIISFLFKHCLVEVCQSRGWSVCIGWCCKRPSVKSTIFDWRISLFVSIGGWRGILEVTAQNSCGRCAWGYCFISGPRSHWSGKISKNIWHRKKENVKKVWKQGKLLCLKEKNLTNQQCECVTIKFLLQFYSFNFLEHSQLCVGNSYSWQSHHCVGRSGQLSFCAIQATGEPVDCVCWWHKPTVDHGLLFSGLQHSGWGRQIWKHHNCKFHCLDETNWCSWERDLYI